MTKSELITRMWEANPHLRQADMAGVVDVFFGAIEQCLADGGRVELRGFGSFKVKVQSARVGRNPRSGDSVPVPERRHVHFRGGRPLLNRLNEEAA